MTHAEALSLGIYGIDSEVERRFWRITQRVFIAFIVISIVVPFLPVLEMSREKQVQVPERVAKVLMQKRQQEKKPPAPQLVPKKEAKKEPPKKKRPSDKKVAKKQPKPVTSAKERVAKVGLLALRDDLAALRETPVLKTLTNPNRKLSNAGSKTAHKEYKPVTRVVNQGSGGVGAKGLKRETVQTQLTERKFDRVDSRLANLADKEQEGESRNATRTIEEIRLVLERYKGSFNILYTKQLRRNPGLRGKVLFELVIAPSGQVISCRVVESELAFPSLERKFVLKFKTIDFGEKDVGTTTINYPLDFFPS